jgi:hypothetical protein
MQEFMVLIFRGQIPGEGISEDHQDVRSLLAWIERLSRSGNFIAGEIIGKDASMASAHQFNDEASMQSPVNACIRITALNVDQAVEIANECPLKVNGTIQVRPVTMFQL